MHHCLSILDIVENICDHVDGAHQLNRPSLAALARTCRSFTGPALNCLWAVQTDGMVNLMRCMPPDLFEFGNDSEIRLLRPILAADWERALVHMRSIRQLHCRVPVPAAVFALYTSFPGDAGSLFPKLTSLHWVNSWGEGQSPSIQLLLSPRLRSLSIFVPLPNAIFSAIQRTCPTLKNLNVYFLDLIFGNADRSGLSACLRGLHSLESAKIVVPDLASLEHLGQLPGLRVSAKFPDNFSLEPLAPLRFIALRSVLLQYDIELATGFFRSCSGVPLEDILIELDLCPTAAAIDRLYAALSEGCSHTSLLSLDINVQDDEPRESEDYAYAVNMQSLRQLFCFVNITSISIASCGGFNIDDEGMKELALAWPQIRELRLSLTPWYADLQLRPKLSLRCLGMLAEHCQALADLEITLDATVIPKPDTEPGTRPVSQSALRNFEVGKSPITSPILHAARYIAALFPSVSELTTYRTYGDNNDVDELEDHAEAIAHHRLWMDVADQLKSFREEE